ARPGGRGQDVRRRHGRPFTRSGDGVSASGRHRVSRGRGEAVSRRAPVVVSATAAQSARRSTPPCRQAVSLWQGAAGGYVPGSGHGGPRPWRSAGPPTATIDRPRSIVGEPDL